MTIILNTRSVISNLISFVDPIKLISSFGYLGIFLIVFAESGLLFGFFLPGDSLLFTAGLLSSKGLLNLWFLIPITFIAAVIGDNVGYSIGLKFGPKLFVREKSLLFDKDHLVKAQKFYEKYGSKTIVLARFMPFIRTFAPIVAGVGQMNYRTFMIYNLFGGFIWSAGVPLAGYLLGNMIPDIDRWLLPIIALIIIFSILPAIYHVLSERVKKR